MSKELQRITGDASIKRYFDTDYIGAYSMEEGAEPILTIDSLWYGELTLGGGRKENHVVIKFREKSVKGCEEVKPLILNATNRKALKKLFGDDSAAVLEGKRIQLYIDPKVRDPQDGGFTEGLRIKPFIPKAEGVPKCADCKKEITGIKTEKGDMSAAQVIALAHKRFGGDYCAPCMKKRDEAKKAAEKKTEPTEQTEPEQTEPVESTEPEQAELSESGESEFERMMKEGQEE